MYGSANDCTTPYGMFAEYERRWAAAEADAKAREAARTEATDDDLNELVIHVEFQDPQKQAEWLEWLEDDSEINQARLYEYVSTEFHEMYRLLTKKAQKYFDEFELDYIF